jgi:anti-sigma regulatory factor (Ser/Thr protein kinase)
VRLELPDTVLRVQEVSEVGAARRAAVSVAERLGFSEADSAKVALAVTELATNLVRHGGGGELILAPLTDGQSGLQVVALDRGAGITNVPEALRDGFSTAGTQGAGLGAVARQADHSELFTVPGAGTVVLARFLRGAAPPEGSLTVGGISLPDVRETVCGDAWVAAAGPERTSIMVADGLGHGPTAAEAANLAVQVFRERRAASPSDIMADAHAALRPTRGAAIGIAEVDHGRGLVTFVGVGNISGVIVTGTATRSLVSHAGIVGHQCRKIQEFTYPWSRDSILVLHSDGLQSHWHLDGYSGLAQRHPTVIAALLYRDHLRGKDDVTVVVARETTR